MGALTTRGAAVEDYADSGEIDGNQEAASLAYIYIRRVKHLAREGLLLIDEASTLADLDAFARQGQARVVVLTEREGDDRLVYTAFLADQSIAACLVHRLPGRGEW